MLGRHNASKKERERKGYARKKEKRNAEKL